MFPIETGLTDTVHDVVFLLSDVSYFPVKSSRAVTVFHIVFLQYRVLVDIDN